MKVTDAALRLTIIVNDSDTLHHKPLSKVIVQRAHDAGLAGASVFHGIEGFGSSALIHTNRLLSLSEDLPVAIVIVDAEEPVRRFLTQLDGLGLGGVVVLDECQITRYVPEDEIGGDTS